MFVTGALEREGGGVCVGVMLRVIVFRLLRSRDLLHFAYVSVGLMTNNEAG